MGQQRQQSNYLGGDSSQEAFISLPLTRAISSGIIRSKKPAPSRVSSGIIRPLEQLISSMAFKRFTVGIAVFGLAFVCAFITAGLLTPVQNSDAASQLAVNIDDTGYYVNVSTSSTNNVVSLDLVATPDGAGVVAKETVTTETNSPTGFKLYISSDSATTGANNLYKDGDNTSSYIPAISGTVSAPAKLAVNTWGYTLANEYNNSSTITSSSYFVGLPLLNSENLLQAVTEAVPTGSGATLDVYYGAKANTAMPAGSYTTNVIYTVLAEGTPAYEGEVSVSPTYSLLAGGSTLTIATGLYTNANDLGTVEVTVDGNSCTDVQRIANGTDESVSLTCTLPANTTVGWKTVAVSIPKFGKSYSLTEGVQYYIPWANLVYMQDMTDIACNQATEATSSNYASVQKTLTDNRDGNTYVVRRLADGNCWMAENLRLTFQNGYAVNVDDGSLTALTSHNSDFATLSSWILSGNTTTFTTGTAWYNSTDNINDEPGSYSFGNAVDDDGSGQYKGALYNWLVATAGTGTSSVTSSDTVIDDSICPKSWMLPWGIDQDKSWYNLVSDLSYSDLRAAPYSIIITANIFAPSGRTVAYYTDFWSRTASSSTHTLGGLRLYKPNTSVELLPFSKGYGRHIRCVSR